MFEFSSYRRNLYCSCFRLLTAVPNAASDQFSYLAIDSPEKTQSKIVAKKLSALS